MTTGLPTIDPEPSKRGEACLPGASTADVLRLLGSGAAGAILMALGESPLRTKDLTEQVPGYATRTIYRYSGKLAELNVVDREEEPGVPSKVVYRLSDPCGVDLHTLFSRFADASLTRLPDGRIDAQAWASLGQLADLWEAGLLEELSCEARSPIDLAGGSHGLSYHQVNRRAGLFRTAGLLCEVERPGRRRLFALTEKTRRTMALVAGVARWRHHHVVAEDEEGMTAAEMATLLRVTLPLATAPRQAGKCLGLRVLDESGQAEQVWAEVEADGTIQSCVEPPSDPHGWGEGTVASWIPVALDGVQSPLQIDGDRGLVETCLDRLHEMLWNPRPISAGGRPPQ
jgi:DNA-binding HxlR family transcriptional regulator